jgi:hypothetical protein
MNKLLTFTSVVNILLLVSCNISAQVDSSATKDSIPVNYQVDYIRSKEDRIQQIKADTGGTVYKFQVRPGDKAINNSNRAEMVLKFESKLNHTYQYSWDFKISGEYTQRLQRKYHMIVAQWLDRPEKGETWDDIKGTQGPPFYLSVVRREDGLYLQIWYGLQNINRKKEAELKIEPDKWNHIKVKAFWSKKDDGYADVSINGTKYHLTGANKYSSLSNIFKVGLYRNKDNQDVTESFVKNISISEIEK